MSSSGPSSLWHLQLQENIEYYDEPSPDGDRQTSPNPDNFMLQQRNGSFGHSLSLKSPLTLPGALVTLNSRIAAPRGEGRIRRRSSAACTAAPYLRISGAIQDDGVSFWLAVGRRAQFALVRSGCRNRGDCVDGGLCDGGRRSCAGRIAGSEARRGERALGSPLAGNPEGSVCRRVRVSQPGVAPSGVAADIRRTVKTRRAFAM